MKRTVVCYGDSITHGQVGASYVNLLRQRLPEQIRVINAGFNGDTTLHLLRRIERDVVPHRPDLVVVLAGLNDIGTAYGDPAMRLYYRIVGNIWVQLTIRRFARAYRHLIIKLRERTGRGWRSAPSRCSASGVKRPSNPTLMPTRR